MYTFENYTGANNHEGRLLLLEKDTTKEKQKGLNYSVSIILNEFNKNMLFNLSEMCKIPSSFFGK